MKGSRKGPTPPQMQAWLDLESDEWKPAYPFDCVAVTNEVRETLLREQRGLCVYCGRRLKLDKPGSTYHIEHFRPQSDFKELSCDYTNLFLSCGLKDGAGKPSPTCGNVKGNWFEDACHIPPDYPNCVLRFRFRPC